MSDKYAHKASTRGVSWRALLAAGAALIPLTHATVATAQGDEADRSRDAATGANANEHVIVVSARFQTERLQDAPLAISAISADDLDARGISSLADVDQIAPNVSLMPAGQTSGRTMSARVRGIGQSDFNFALEPAVGIYIDDVYFATLFGSQFGLLDIERIEVLRGPQGTLFGKNSEAGAIRVVTKVPRGDGSGYVEAGYGSYDRVRMRGAFDVPVVEDRLFLRVSGGFDRYDGYVDVLDFACDKPNLAGTMPRRSTLSSCKMGEQGGESTASVRGALRWVSPDLEINLNADFTKSDGQPGPYVPITYDPANPTLAAFNTQRAIPLYGIPLDQRFLPDSPFATYQSFTNPFTGREFPSVNDIRSWGATGRIEWSGIPGITVTSITSYRGYSGSFTSDQGSSPFAFVLYTRDLTHRQFSQELRLAGKLLDGSVDWIAGGYYFDGKSRNEGQIATELIVPAGQEYYMNDPANSTSKSVFGHVIAHLTDKLDLEAGARYSFDKKDYTFLRQLVRPFNALPTGTLLFPITTGVTSSERFDPKVALSYRWTGDIMTYAQVATGYKAGGFNPRAGSVAQVVSFDPEDVITYELGAKTEWFDRRARLNAAVFRSDYKNLQMQATAYDNNGVPAILYSNVGKARIQGIELEGNLEPIDGLQLSGQIGYLDYKTIDIGTATNIVLGARAPNVPKWSWALGAQYEIGLGSGGSLTPRIDYIYRGETNGDFLATPTLIEPHYGLLNLHLTWQSDDGDWSVSGEMLNATDKYYYTGKHTGAGNLAGSPGQPRTMLVTVKRQF